jgi:site-specific DNA-methyltransferase (adenine-specific)
MNNIELFNGHFQNYKSYNIPKAQLVIADIPYNVGKDAYGSNPMWYNGGDRKNGESKLAGKEFWLIYKRNYFNYVSRKKQ